MKDCLKGCRCVVIGATGNIGRGAAKAFIEYGAEKVAIIGRKESRLIALHRDYLGRDPRVIIISGDMASPEGAQVTASVIKSQLGRIDHLVSSSGPWWQTGPFSELDALVWQEARRANVDSHFYTYRYLKYLIQGSGSFVIMNGAAADSLPDSGLTGFCAFAVRGLCKVLLSEGSADGLRIYELLLSMRVADGPPMPGMKSEVFGKVFAAIAANRVNYPAGSTIRVTSGDDIRMMTDL